ncbi:NADH-quinone oxidoreductase subunit NuoN [[Mycobacterium] burgundiense]|uniref:NADH-quinone oxidoreductase subunit N n=1 Tax=[Mycobacterium] burgundiense TaxID=3064286 RepID=A0ABN9NMT4_9MYCO|nr:NADH-quinone oxidoreductase subunit NuoN [Mycolicibacterium sp. MU0053]CAJ1507254.1 NADH-quinone oxidoreductase subunit NuoN [Mycolicibacterium sp. MU0053]
MTTVLALQAPSVEYAQLSPMLIVIGVAVAGVLVEAFLPRRLRYRTQLLLSLGGLSAALIAAGILLRDLGDGTGTSAVTGSVAVDAPALFLQVTVLVIAILGVLLIAERRAPSPESDDPAGGLDAFTPQAAAVPGSVAEKEATRAGIIQTEVFPFTMFAVTGMLLFGAADDLLTMFIALEVLSLPLYLVCGLARHRRLLSQEAALKYFLLGAFSSAFFLYGMALLYGYSGTFALTGIADAIAEPGGQSSRVALVGVGLVAVGLLFKVGAVPFHSWVPDVYQGAPTPITGFMAAATKVAAFGAMLRLFYVAVPELQAGWRPMMWAVAIATMVIGTVAAVRQTNVKRLLAYSAVSHAGFILTGVVALTDSGVSSTLFYLFAYGFSTLGAFAVVGLVRDSTGAEDSEMARWAGLGRRYPLVGAVFALFLLAFAGIPLTSGFVSKFAVFKAAGEGGAMPLVVVGVVASAIAAYFYIRVIVWMFFTDPPPDAPVVVVPSWTGKATVGLTAGITLLLGALPQPLLDLANNSTQFLR